MKHSDAALGLAFFRLFCASLCLLLDLELVEILIHLVEAVIDLVDNHMILEHVLVISHAHHGHR